MAVGTALAIAGAVGGVANLVGNLAKGDGGKAAAKGTELSPLINGQQAANTLAQGQNASDQLAYGISNANNGVNQQQDFVSALNAQNGVANQSSVFNQLQGVANGTGPNPAQAMLAQSTGANVANQAALLAGQRGSGANVGLAGRNAAMAGGNIQQNAAGQAATMQAQQSLGALNQLGGIAGQQVAQRAQGISQANALLQAQQQAQLQQLQNNTANNLGQFQSQQQNAINMQSNINSSNAGLAQQNAQNANNSIGGALSGVAGAVGALSGGGAGVPPTAIGGGGGGGGGLASGTGASGVDLNLGTAKFAEGGQVPKPYKGESHLARLSHEHVSGKFKPMSNGGKVAGKPVVGGAKDSYANDKVKALLSPGEIVIPRSITQGPNAAEKAAAFVAAIKAKGGKK